MIAVPAARSLMCAQSMSAVSICAFTISAVAAASAVAFWELRAK